MIIIRTQDRMTLIKCKEVYAYELCVTDKETVYRLTDGENILGEYKTEERALEVLDEIEKHIECVYGAVIYRMPKE